MAININVILNLNATHSVRNNGLKVRSSGCLEIHILLIKCFPIFMINTRGILNRKPHFSGRLSYKHLYCHF